MPVAPLFRTVVLVDPQFVNEAEIIAVSFYSSFLTSVWR